MLKIQDDFPNFDHPTRILSILHLSLLVCLFPLASHAETSPLVEDEPILVPATKGKFDYLKVDEQFHRLLANHTGNGTLDVFDLPDGKLRQTVQIGAVHDVAIDAERGKYYVTVSDPSNLTIVDRQTLKVEGSVPLPDAADGCAYDSKNGLVYVDRDDGEDARGLIRVRAGSWRRSKYPRIRNLSCTILFQTGSTRI